MADTQKFADVRKPVRPTIFQHVGGIASYPIPNVLDKRTVIAARPLLGFLPPPKEPAPPSPQRPALSPPPPGWVSSHHAAPAAYPRLMREGHGDLGRDAYPWGPERPRQDETRQERMQRVDREAIVNVRGRYDAKLWSVEEAVAAAPPKQWISVERWRRLEPQGGYTLMCAHAGGLQKEHWHEVIRKLIEEGSTPTRSSYGGGRLARPAEFVIDEVWMMDDLHHNESVTLNNGRLGPVQSWEDAGRDLLNIVQHVIPAVQVGEEASWDLEWVASAPRPRVIGCGQSFGGNALIHAAHARPDLFDGVFLVDPPCFGVSIPREIGYEDPVKAHPLTPMILRRRDIWPSRREAGEILRSSAFFAPFTDAAFEVYLKRGLVLVDPSNPEGPVELATPMWAESVTFTETDAAALAYDKLLNIDIPMAWVLAGNSAVTRGDAQTQQTVWRSPRARNERYLGTEHLLNQQSPELVVQSLQRFLVTLSAKEWDAPAPVSANL